MAPFLMELHFRYADSNAEIESRFEERLDDIRISAVDFQTYTAAYVSAVLEERSQVSEAKQRLLDNIVEQDAKVQFMQPLLSDNEKEAANEYRRALLELSNLIPVSDDVLEMAPFWEATSDVLVARNDFLKIAAD